MLEILAGVFFLLAGVCMGVMDTLQHHFSVSIFRNRGNFWNPKESWRNKYRNGEKEQGPKFPFSTTALVFLTDAWHFFQFLMLSCLRTALALLAASKWPLEWFYWVGVWVLLIPVFSGGFHLTYSWLLVINKKSKI